jgi:hypothetical protein
MRHGHGEGKARLYRLYYVQFSDFAKLAARLARKSRPWSDARPGARFVEPIVA